jgi:NAD(P)-dependent dehydrogenase (short-subunit alcohol dehydrogenase family)
LNRAERELLAAQPASLGVDGRVAWVTGASRGLGHAIAMGLAEAGARVALTSRSGGRLAEVRETIQQAGGEALVVAGSVDSPDQMRQAAQAIEQAWGRIDILVNNAGISPTFKRSELLSDDEWAQVLRVNLTGCFYCCREAGRIMLARGRGSIVNVSSVHGSVGAERLAAYAASKAGMEALTRTLALEWAERGVRVNAIAPGYFETDLTEGLRDGRWRQRLLDRIPVGVFGLPEQVVPAVLFLAGDGASYVTGVTLSIDGGWTAQ